MNYTAICSARKRKRRKNSLEPIRKRNEKNLGNVKKKTIKENS
jgi:hypothetical protein